LALAEGTTAGSPGKDRRRPKTAATPRRGLAFYRHQEFRKLEGLMTNSQTHAAIALGSALIVGGFVAFLPPVPPASAQSQAQRICREQGVKPNTEGYEYCLSQTTRALEWGEPEMAYRFARVAADAREACLGYGLQPKTAGLQACIDKETSARALLIYASEEPEYGPQIADHP
jgi:hypothetical protein